MKVLLSAYACEPGKGSEPGVGWHWVLQISRFHEVWVITRANNRERIEAALAAGAMPNVHWYYYDLPYWARFWKKGGQGVHLYYYLWQVGAYLIAHRLHMNVAFDVAHHITFGVYWLPSFMAYLPIPFVMGPVGGGEEAPRSFHRTFSLRGRFYEWLRTSLRNVAEWDPFVRYAIRHSSIALAKSHETAACLARLGAPSVRIWSEAGITADEIEQWSRCNKPKSTPFRVVSVGRLFHFKGFHLGIMAFSQFHKQYTDSEYWIIGDGPERQRLESLAEDLGIRAQVRCFGALPRGDVLERIGECDVLVHPVLHDSGGWACLEGMAAGKPVVCLNIGGPATQVTDSTGFTVAAVSPEQAVADMADALYCLAKDPTLREQMGSEARALITRDFEWNHKGDRIRLVYEELIGGE